MSVADLKSPGKLRPLMVALRRLALFPQKSVAVVSTETACELSDLHAYIHAHGRPSRSDIDDLEDIVAVDQRPGQRLVTAPAEVSSTKIKVNRPPAGSAEKKVIYALRIFVSDLEINEKAACTRAGVHQSTFSQFKRRNFIPGRVDRQRAARFLLELDTKDGKAPAKPALKLNDREEIDKAEKALIELGMKKLEACRRISVAVELPSVVKEAGALVTAALKVKPADNPKIFAAGVAAKAPVPQTEKAVAQAAVVVHAPVVRDRDIKQSDVSRRSPPGCWACGGFTVYVRGRHPDEGPREICPTCITERLDAIIEIVTRQPPGSATSTGGANR